MLTARPVPASHVRHMDGIYKMASLLPISDRIARATSIIVLLLLLNACVPEAHGQALVDLTLTGPSAVVEGQTVPYRATARFDDDSEFEVTLFCDWAVEPGDHAFITVFGRLSTVDVDSDELLLITAEFSWDDTTLDASREVTIIDIPSKEGSDPWPFWGRNAQREGYTSTWGPQTPTPAWSLVISDYPFENLLEGSPVMDSYGRIVVANQSGVAVVDSTLRERIWTFDDGDFPRGVAVWGGRVLWGDVAPFTRLNCFHTQTGDELWTMTAPTGFGSQTPVIDSNGVVYITDSFGTMYARGIEDGSEVWTTTVGDSVYSTGSLLEPITFVTGGGPIAFDLVALDPASGDEHWRFHTDREVFGTPVVLTDRVVFASTDRYLYSLDRETGEEQWRFWAEQFHRGSVAVAPDGTIYSATSGNEGLLFAVFPSGEQYWRLPLPGLVSNSPIAAGNGLIYVTSSNWTGQIYESRVHAVRTDGTELWSYMMPDDARASPMLAPDGTLYLVCRDKNLYAFRDPAGDLNYDQVIDLADFSTIDQCLTRPRIWGEASLNIPGCELLDFNSDWDVDLHDYAVFQNSNGTVIPAD